MGPIDPAWSAGTLLLWARLGAFFAFSPLVTATKVPRTFVVLFALVLAGLFASSMVAPRVPPATLAQLVFALLGEVAIGALLGFALQCAFGAFALAGQILDVQMGFGLASLYNPVTQSNSPVIGSVLSLVGLALFFAVEGHHAAMRALAFSVQALPPGGLWHVPDAGSLLRPFGAVFTVGMVVVAPVLLMLFLTDVALGYASRVLPQMNVFFVGIPAKLLVGLAVLAGAAPQVGGAMMRSYEAVFRFWAEVLR